MCRKGYHSTVLVLQLYLPTTLPARPRTSAGQQEARVEEAEESGGRCREAETRLEELPGLGPAPRGVRLTRRWKGEEVKAGPLRLMDEEEPRARRCALRWRSTVLLWAG